MAEARVVQDMFASIAERYDLTNSILSFGIHHFWRQQLISLLPEAADKKVLDVCTGTGDLLPLLKKRFGSAIGIDFCMPMLTVAKQKGLQGCGALINGDALHLPFANDSFEVISAAFGVRNFENLEIGLAELLRILKPGGAVLILDFGKPWLPGFAAIFDLYSRFLMPLIGGFITGNREAYVYLPKTAREFPSGRVFIDILKRLGFKAPSYRSLTGGIAYAYVAYK